MVSTKRLVGVYGVGVLRRMFTERVQRRVAGVYSIDEKASWGIRSGDVEKDVYGAGIEKSG